MGHERLGPPYAPAANLATIFTAWRDTGTPARVDRHWFERIGLSANLATRNIHALRYLRLVDDGCCPTELAERLRVAPAPAFAATLEPIVRTAYARVWALCDPGRASRSQIEDAFRHERPDAQRVRMVGCFLGLCALAGIRPAETAPPRRPAVVHRSPAGRPVRVDAPPPAPDGLATLLAKFPAFDPAWTDSVKEKWFDAFARIYADLRATIVP
jgi:hypothetical protein